MKTLVASGIVAVALLMAACTPVTKCELLETASACQGSDTAPDPGITKCELLETAAACR